MNIKTNIFVAAIAEGDSVEYLVTDNNSGYPTTSKYLERNATTSPRFFDSAYDVQACVRDLNTSVLREKYRLEVYELVLKPCDLVDMEAVGDINKEIEALILKRNELQGR